MTKRRGNVSRVSPKSGKLDAQILQNIVELQKIYVDTGEKFDKLTSQISSLLELFEESAKSFAKQPQVREGDRELVKKLDQLLEQNKTIAKGLTIIDQKVRDKQYSPLVKPHSQSLRPSLRKPHQPQI